MPWTVSHATAVLPLRRYSPWPLDFAALVVGSMTPDLGYYIGRFDLATFDHTLAGSFLVGLPCGMLVLLAVVLFCKPFCYALPSPHRPALLAICPSFVALRPARWGTVLVSLLFGIWTHNFWDAWTHETGWFVRRIPALRTTIVHLGSVNFALPFVLQVLSTLAGFAIVAAAYFLWLRRERRRLFADGESDAWRYLFWLVIALVSLLVALPLALHFAANRQGVMFVRAVMFRTALYAPDIGIPLSLLAVSIIYTRRRRVAPLSPRA